MVRNIKLSCVLMDNNEILFNGRSLGFFSDEEIKTHMAYTRAKHMAYTRAKESLNRLRSSLRYRRVL